MSLLISGKGKKSDSNAFYIGKDVTKENAPTYCEILTANGYPVNLSQGGTEVFYAISRLLEDLQTGKTTLVRK